MHKKGFVWIPVAIIIVAVVAFATAAIMIYRYNQEPKSIACTEEAKLCPDGSYVGRVAPSCEFAACPTVNTNTANINVTSNTNTTANTNVAANINATANTNTAVLCPTDAKLCPDGSSVGRSGADCEFAACPASDVPPTDIVSPSNPKVHVYTSSKLGVRFSYWSSADMGGANVLEQGNKIYIYPDDLEPMQGQRLEVYSKDASATLASAVTKDFLSGIKPSDCYVEPLTTNIPTGQAVQINFPHSGGLDDPSWNNREKCPSAYTVTNGLLYFWSDEAHLEKYAFLSIGQYYIGGTSATTPWQESLEFLD